MGSKNHGNNSISSRMGREIGLNFIFLPVSDAWRHPLIEMLLAAILWRGKIACRKLRQPKRILFYLPQTAATKSEHFLLSRKLQRPEKDTFYFPACCITLKRILFCFPQAAVT
jgi:hypothetical protein